MLMLYVFLLGEMYCVFFFFKQKTSYEMRISDWSSDVCSSDLLGGMARPLEELVSYDGGFDVIITCTGAARPIITPEIYHSLLKGETGEKIIVDLALPSDTSDELRDSPGVRYIGMEHLQETVRRNMNERYLRSEEHTSELQSLMHISSADFFLKK